MKKISRIEFIKLSGLAYLAFQTGCTPTATTERSVVDLSLEYLLPDDGNFPTYKDAFTEKYIAFLKTKSVLEDFQLERLENGQDLIEELSLEKFQRKVTELKRNEREELFNEFIETNQGYAYFSFLQKLQIESMLADAYYNLANSAKIKQWLELPVMFPSADNGMNFTQF